MKIPLRDVDEFLNDPAQWADRQLAAAGQVRPGYTHLTRMSIYRFHKSGSLALARNALIGYMDSRGLTNLERRQQAEHNLERYVSWAQTSDDFVIGHAVRMRLELASGMYVAGHIHRIDLVAASGVHQPVMLEAGANASTRVLAGAVKLGYASAASRDPAFITPAHQNLDGSGLTRISISDSQTEELLRRLHSASREAARILAR